MINVFIPSDRVVGFVKCYKMYDSYFTEVETQGPTPTFRVEIVNVLSKRYVKPVEIDFPRSLIAFFLSKISGVNANTKNNDVCTS